MAFRGDQGLRPMPSLTPRIIPRSSPGVYLTEDTYGAAPTALAQHGNVYVLGTCTGADFPTNQPTFIESYADFLARAISSPSAAAIQSFFDQRSGAGLYFVAVKPRQEATLTAATFSSGTVLSITAGLATVTYTCAAGETAATAANSLGDKINKELAGYLTYYPGTPATLRFPIGQTVTASPGLTLGAPATAAAPKALDVADAIKLSFVPELGQGYICAPEFYAAFTLQAERTALQQALEALASDPRYYWISVVDFGLATINAASIVSAARAERQLMISPKGHSWAVFPYLINLAGTKIPPSLAMIGVALRRARAEGFAQPPAGTSYPLYGVTGLSGDITNVVQDVLNPLGINCIRSLPARGIVVYGARTLSANSYYTFAATRVILNVLAGTLRNSFDSVVFSLIDGQGVLLSRIKQRAANVCEILRQGGALYGPTPDEAYLVVCDASNNPGLTLDTGTVNLDVVVKVSPTMEVLNISLSATSLATTLLEVTAAGEVTPPQGAGNVR